MTTPLKVVAVVGSLSRPSKTRALVDLVIETMGDVEQVDARVIENADIVIAASPVFRGSYTGMFKHFFDLVDQMLSRTRLSFSRQPVEVIGMRWFSIRHYGHYLRSSKRGRLLSASISAPAISTGQPSSIPRCSNVSTWPSRTFFR